MERGLITHTKLPDNPGKIRELCPHFIFASAKILTEQLVKPLFKSFSASPNRYSYNSPIFSYKTHNQCRYRSLLPSEQVPSRHSYVPESGLLTVFFPMNEQAELFLSRPDEEPGTSHFHDKMYPVHRMAHSSMEALSPHLHFSSFPHMLSQHQNF